MPSTGKVKVGVRLRNAAIFIAVALIFSFCAAGFGGCDFGAASDEGASSGTGSGISSTQDNSSDAASSARSAHENASANETEGGTESSGVASGAGDNAGDNAGDDAGAGSTSTFTFPNNSSDGGRLIVRFIDVGQGDCVLVSCDGQNMLIDGGKSGASSKIYAILRTLGIDYLDVVVGSHPDADHIGATSGALQAAGCGVFYCSSATSDTLTYSTLVSRVDALGIGVTVPHSGDSFALGGATCTFVEPGRDLGSDNNNSLVLRLDFGSTSFLFTGDAEVEEEDAILASGANVDVDVLKVAHHGSKSSSGAAFLRAVSPAYAVISVGENSYGHPTQKALDALTAAGATTLRTDEVGTITFFSDGATLTYKTTTGKVVE